MGLAPPPSPRTTEGGLLPEMALISVEDFRAFPRKCGCSLGRFQNLNVLRRPLKARGRSGGLFEPNKASIQRPCPQLLLDNLDL